MSSRKDTYDYEKSDDKLVESVKMGSYGVSIVTTTFNEREYIPVFVARVREALKNVPHEVIVVDDSSPDGTYEVARKLADKAYRVYKFGQSRGLLYGIERASYPVVITLDADLENPPELIPKLLEEFKRGNYDILVASRMSLPRLSEKITSKTLGKILGVSDVYSNFRVYRRDYMLNIKLRLGETFGGELLVIAKKRGLRIGEYLYKPPPRRSQPRIGGTLKANLRIMWATLKLLVYYFLG